MSTIHIYPYQNMLYDDFHVTDKILQNSRKYNKIKKSLYFDKGSEDTNIPMYYTYEIQKIFEQKQIDSLNEDLKEKLFELLGISLSWWSFASTKTLYEYKPNQVNSYETSEVIRNQKLRRMKKNPNIDMKKLESDLIHIFWNDIWKNAMKNMFIMWMNISETVRKTNTWISSRLVPTNWVEVDLFINIGGEDKNEEDEDDFRPIDT